MFKKSPTLGQPMDRVDERPGALPLSTLGSEESFGRRRGAVGSVRAMTVTDVGDLYALGIRLTPGGPPFVITSVRGVLVENKNQCAFLCLLPVVAQPKCAACIDSAD
jgi:hypothetical protein